MSEDEIKQGVRDLAQSGKISTGAARMALANPVEGEKLVRMEDIRTELNRQGGVQDDMGRVQEAMGRALYGDEKLQTDGLVSDVRFLKINFWRAFWTLSGIIMACTTLLALLGLLIEYSKK